MSKICTFNQPHFYPDPYIPPLNKDYVVNWQRCCNRYSLYTFPFSVQLIIKWVYIRERQRWIYLILPETYFLSARTLVRHVTALNCLIFMLNNNNLKLDKRDWRVVALNIYNGNIYTLELIWIVCSLLNLLI